MARVTLASLDQKLESFMDLVKRHMEDDSRMFERISDNLYGNGKPGLKTRVELTEKELDEIEASRSRSLKAIWGTFAAVVSAIIIKFFMG